MPEIIPIFEKRFQIPSYFVDDRSQLTINALFSLLQEVSNSHATLLGAGWHELLERGYFWVLTKMQLKICRLPEWTEPVVLRSWVRKSDAATSPRDYEMTDANGNLLIAGSSIWAILDTTAGRPQRMSMFDGMFLPQERAALDRRPAKIGPLALPDTLPEAKEVVHSDIDMNHHVNNANYIRSAKSSGRRTASPTCRSTSSPRRNSATATSSAPNRSPKPPSKPPSSPPTASPPTAASKPIGIRLLAVSCSLARH